MYEGVINHKWDQWPSSLKSLIDKWYCTVAVVDGSVITEEERRREAADQ